MTNSTPGGARDTLREGVAEVRAKLGSDISNWTRLRRNMSVQKVIDCEGCAGAGRVACSACAGSGKAGIAASGEETPCGSCNGTGSFTCVECAGQGRVANPHRKKVLWLVAIGCACWAAVFLMFYLQERDLLPGMRAEGGGEMRAGAPRGGGMQRSAPGTGAGAGGYQAPAGGGGYQAPAGGGYQAPAGGGYQRPVGGGYQQPVGGGYQQPAGR